MAWFFPTKKEVKEAFKKVSDDIEVLKDKTSKLEGSINVLINRSQVSVSKKKSQTIKTKIANRLSRMIKKPIKQKIEKLLNDGLRTNDIKRDIVDKHKLCSRATFFRYLNDIKRSHKEIETKVET